MAVLLFDAARGVALLDAARSAKEALPPGCSDRTADQFAIDRPFARDSGGDPRAGARSSRKRARPKWGDAEVIRQLSEALEGLRKSPEGRSFFSQLSEAEAEEAERDGAEGREEEEGARNAAAFRVAQRLQGDFGLPEACYALAVFDRDRPQALPGFHSCVRNDSENDWVLAEVLGEVFFLPPRAAFVMSDLRVARQLLLSAYGSSRFDLVVMDPPWVNKSAKRQKRYHTLENGALLDLPLRGLLAPTGLLALWCTNSAKHQRYLEDCLLPAWNLRLVAKWLWLKVTRFALPVLPLDFAQRRAFEVLYLAAPASFARQVPAQLVFASVPSCLHSRKPPLLDLLRQFLQLPAGRRSPHCLELFARDLRRGWSSWGNEPLRFQHEGCFERRDGAAFRKADLSEGAS